MMAKILVVDDDIHATTLFRTILTAKGYDAFIVNDSAIAVQTADSTKPDLIILDLMMPGLTGFELCKLFRDDSGFANVPILIVSAKDDPESKKQAMDLGATDYVIKPFNVDELLDLIKSLVSN